MRLRSSSGGLNSQRRFFFCLVQGSEKKRWEFWSPTCQFRFELQKFQRIHWIPVRISAVADICFQNSVELSGKSGQKNLYAVNGASSATSFWNRRYFQSINFSLVPICFFEIKMKNENILFLFFLVQDENQHMTFCLCTVIQMPNKIHYQLLKVFYFILFLLFSIIFKIPKINIKIKKKGFVLCGFLSSKIFVFLVGWLEFRCLQRNM